MEETKSCHWKQGQGQGQIINTKLIMHASKSPQCQSLAWHLLMGQLYKKVKPFYQLLFHTFLSIITVIKILTDSFDLAYTLMFCQLDKLLGNNQQ